MSERITRADVNRIATSVSEALPEPLSVVPQGRNGYIGLDLYLHRGTDPMRGWIMLDTLHVGRARECYTYLQGMLRFHSIDTAESQRGWYTERGDRLARL